jgi:hypothetical protein
MPYTYYYYSMNLATNNFKRWVAPEAIKQHELSEKKYVYTYTNIYQVRASAGVPLP